MKSRSMLIQKKRTKKYAGGTEILGGEKKNFMEQRQDEKKSRKSTKALQNNQTYSQ